MKHKCLLLSIFFLLWSIYILTLICDNVDKDLNEQQTALFVIFISIGACFFVAYKQIKESTT